MWIKNNAICLCCVNSKITKKIKFGLFGNDTRVRNIAVHNNAYGYA